MPPQAAAEMFRAEAARRPGPGRDPPRHPEFPACRELPQTGRQIPDHLIRITGRDLPSRALVHQGMRPSQPQADHGKTGRHGLQNHLPAGIMQARIEKAIRLAIGRKHIPTGEGSRKHNPVADTEGSGQLLQTTAHPTLPNDPQAKFRHTALRQGISRPTKSSVNPA